MGENVRGVGFCWGNYRGCGVFLPEERDGAFQLRFEDGDLTKLLQYFIVGRTCRVPEASTKTLGWRVRPDVRGGT